MTSLINVQRVKYQCSCGTLKSLCYLYFCRHCLKLKCKDCVIFEVDCRFCPACYEQVQPHEAVSRKNRCQNCFSCPACHHTLVTRATNTSATLAASSNLNTTTDGDPDESLSQSTTASGLQTPSKKVYYLACSVCRWSTRDIRLPDQPVLNGWKAQENPHENRFNELLQHYKQIATKEKQERDRKRYSTVKLRNPMLAASSRGSTDKYGLLAPLARRGIRTGGMLKTPSVSEPPPPTGPKPAETLKEISPLDENFFLGKTFDFQKLTTIEQRLNSVESQPLAIDQLYPLAKHFTSKQSKRCKECDHNVLKPEPSPKLTKFKLHQMALLYIPEVRIWHHPAWATAEENACILSLINQSDEQIDLKIFTLEEILAEKADEAFCQRIEQMKGERLTGELTFPLQAGRKVQMHPRLESNEIDPKLDEEFRQADPKELVIYRKFAKVAVRCALKVTKTDAKKVLVGRSTRVNFPSIASFSGRHGDRTPSEGFPADRRHVDANGRRTDSTLDSDRFRFDRRAGPAVALVPEMKVFLLLIFWAMGRRRCFVFKQIFYFYMVNKERVRNTNSKRFVFILSFFL